jgi:hypothetical protein
MKITGLPLERIYENLAILGYCCWTIHINWKVSILTQEIQIECDTNFIFIHSVIKNVFVHVATYTDINAALILY